MQTLSQIRLKGKTLNLCSEWRSGNETAVPSLHVRLLLLAASNASPKKEIDRPILQMAPLCTHPSIYNLRPFSCWDSPVSLPTSLVLHPVTSISPKMFQVASAQPHNLAAGHVHQSQHQVPAKSLPRRLARPELKVPNPKIIAAVSPELAGVPIEYIRRGLLDMGAE